jgi:plasmid rolling circle replication initiator protein Rep
MSKKKKGSEILACVYGRTNIPDRERKAKRLHLCGKTLIYAENPAGGEAIPVSAMRCGLRLCPSCSWIRARQIFQNVYSVITEPDFSCKQFIFLTLTVKNCRSVFLESEISRILSAWRDLTKDERQPFRRSFSGTFRALEVTYNPLKKTYHPHLHAMAAVDKKYFKKSNQDYISQSKLRKLWRDACGLDYLPQCRIEKVKNTAKKQVAEVAKYTVKSADYLNRPAVLEALDPALKGKRLIAYGGLFKVVKKRLNLPDEDELDELPKLTVEELLNNPYIRKIILEWEMGAYRVRPYQPSADPAEWLKPERLIADGLRRQAAAWGQGGA